MSPAWGAAALPASVGDAAATRTGENDLHSAAHRSVTVVTVMTLIFTPMLRGGHHWVDVLTGKTTETRVEQCRPNEPCPAQKHITQKIVLQP